MLTMAQVIGYEQGCPSCGHTIDADIEAFGDARPTPGDVSVCLYCTSYLVFNHDLTRRLMSNEDFLDLDGETKNSLARVKAAIQVQKALSA